MSYLRSPGRKSCVLRWRAGKVVVRRKRLPDCWKLWNIWMLSASPRWMAV